MGSVSLAGCRLQVAAGPGEGGHASSVGMDTDADGGNDGTQEREMRGDEWGVMGGQMGGWSPAWPPESAAMKSAGKGGGRENTHNKARHVVQRMATCRAHPAPEPATIESATQGEFCPTSADLDGWMWGGCWRRAQRPFRPQFRTRRLPIDLLPTGLHGPVFVGPDDLVWTLVGLGTNSSMRTRNLRLAAPALLLPKMGPIERRTNVSRTAARLPTPLDVSILLSSRDFDNMSAHQQQSTKIHREAARREGRSAKRVRQKTAHPISTRPTPTNAQGFFFLAPPPSPRPPAYMLHRTREKPSPAGTSSPSGEPIRPPSPPSSLPQARLLTYMRSSPTARNPTTQPSKKRGFRSKLITVSLPRLPPLRNNTVRTSRPPRHPSQISQTSHPPGDTTYGTPTKPTRASRPPQDLPKDPTSLWGGGGNPHSGLDSSRRAAGQNPQWDRSPAFRLLGPSPFVPDKMFSPFFFCLPAAQSRWCVCHSLV